MRKIIAYFIKYPVAVNILLLAFFIFGIRGILQMKSSFFPLRPTSTITISIAYPGASPEEIEEGIVLKIEDNLQGLIGVDRVTSKSSENSATITVEAFENADIDVVLADVKNAVDRVPNFPTGMEPPIVAKRESNDEAINLTISGENVPLKTLKQITRKVETDLRAIEGISQLEITGFPQEEIEIAVRENNLRAYDLTFDEVARAVANANILTTGGNIKTETEEYLIRANNRSYYGDELDYIIVRSDASGRKIRLKDVATTRDKWSESPDRLYYNGNTAIQVRVSTTNNEDLVLAAEKTVKYIDKFNQENNNVQINVTRNASKTISERTQLLVENGGIGILLVLILLSLFLKPTLAFWVAVGLPVSFLGMFIFAPNLITINVISLFGMIIVIGILVDDGIVIGENIFYHYEQGKTATQAAIDGTMEVIVPIVSAILTTIVAFATFFFVEGRIGSFFSEVAIVVLFTLGISLIEALIILPAHIAHSRALKKNKKPFILNVYGDKIMLFLREKIYAPVLRFFLQNQFFSIAIPISLLIVTLGAIGGSVIKITFFPSIASDRATITLKMPQGTSENITDSLISIIEVATAEVNKEFTAQQTGNLEVIQSTIRRIGPGTANATLFLNLLPGEARDNDITAEAVTNALQEKVGPIHGVESLEFNSGSNFRGKPVSVSLISNDIKELKAAKEELKRRMAEIPQLKDISDNNPTGIKEIKLKLKDNAYALGLSLNEVMSQIRSGFFGRSVQRFQRGQDEIRVWVRYDKQDRKSIKNLDDMWIVTPSQNRVPLSEIADYQIDRGEVSINHLNGKREILVEANLKSFKESATDMLGIVQTEIMPDIHAEFPNVSALYEGQNRDAQKTAKSIRSVSLGILFLIYAIIAFSFRSYIQPLLLFMIVPFSLVGVAWGHYIHGFPINILSMLGIIALIGIVVNDGLVLIEKFNGFLKQGLPFEDALYEAGKSRFRAILLTSITTVAGLGPLIFEESRQAQFIIPMAISIAYGIFFATFLTLFLLPTLLHISNSVKVGFSWLLTGKWTPREKLEAAIIEQQSEEEDMGNSVGDKV